MRATAIDSGGRTALPECRYLMDLSPYPPMCDHPIRSYGGGASEARCRSCAHYEPSDPTDPHAAFRAAAEMFERGELASLTAKCEGLRQMVADMWAVAEPNDDCFDTCRHHTDGPDSCSRVGRCWFERRMEEFFIDPHSKE